MAKFGLRVLDRSTGACFFLSALTLGCFTYARLRARELSF